jgi:hypothetical protein
MAERWDDQEFSEISRLIREEEDRALEIFRQRNFDQKIRTWIAAGSPAKRGLFGKRMAIPATIAALIVVTAGIIFVATRRSGLGPQLRPGPMAVILGALPGSSDLAMPRATVPVGEPDAVGPARAFRLVLALATQVKEEEQRRVAVPTENLSVPRLSLEKKMEILFKDRAIERVLIRMIKKSEEV